MKATLFSLALAALLWFYPPEPLPYDWILPLSAVFLAALPLLFAFSWGPLQRGEQNITPRLIEMFTRDDKIRLYTSLLFLFPLVSLGLWSYLSQAKGASFFLGWIVFLGIALDLMVALIRRITGYLDPFKAVSIIAENSQKEISKNHVGNLVDGIDALSDISSKAVMKGNASLAQEGVQELRDLGVQFLQASKSFANLAQDLDTAEKGQVDKVAYTFFSLLTHLEEIGTKAASASHANVVNQTLTSLGRLAIASANYDLTLTTHPFLALGNVTLAALNHNEKESAIKGEIVMLEAAKAIVKENDLTYGDIKSPFTALLKQLDAYEKERFQKDKEIDMNLLTNPFYILKELFLEEKLKNHPDTPVLLQETDRILGEFSALEQVMRTLPQIPTILE